MDNKKSNLIILKKNSLTPHFLVEIFFRKISRFSASQHNRKPITFAPKNIRMSAVEEHSCSPNSITMPTPSKQKTTPAKSNLIIIRYLRFIIILSFLGLKSQFYSAILIFIITDLLKFCKFTYSLILTIYFPINI